MSKTATITITVVITRGPQKIGQRKAPVLEDSDRKSRVAWMKNEFVAL